MTTIADSYRSQSWSQRVLRVWLGITFIYAGWNKASDATFFTKGSSHYIGTQLTGFAHGSPLRPFLDLAAHQAVAVGWLTLLTEMAIGIAILLNVASLPAAIAGGLLSLTLWLSSSWHVHPYFLASDPAYFIMWSAYAIALFQQRAQKKALPVIVARGSRNRVQAATPANVDRRAVVRIGMVGGLAIFGGVLGRLFASPASKKQSANAGPSSSTGAATNTTGANVLVALASLPVGSAVNFTASNGDPAVLIRTSSAKVCAFDAICTHNGCTVEFDPGSQSLICPCHGAQYDPRAHAAVLAGPATTPLTEIKVKISGSNIILA